MKPPFTCEQEENWEDEFDKKFKEKIDFVNYCLSEGDTMFDSNDVKSFIHNILIKQDNMWRTLLSEHEAKVKQDIADWAKKYILKDMEIYGTDKHGIALVDLLKELKIPPNVSEGKKPE